MEEDKEAAGKVLGCSCGGRGAQVAGRGSQDRGEWKEGRRAGTGTAVREGSWLRLAGAAAAAAVLLSGRCCCCWAGLGLPTLG